LRFSKTSDDQNLFGQLFGTTIGINIILGSLLLSFCLPFSNIIAHAFHSATLSQHILLMSSAALAQSLFQHGVTFYRARNNARKYTVVSLFASGSVICFSYLFLVLLPKGIDGALLAFILAYTWPLCLIYYDLRKEHINLSFSLKKVPELLRFGWPLTVSSLGGISIGAITIYVLTYLEGPDIVAIFSLGQKLAQLVSFLLLSPFQLAFLPLAFENHDEPQFKTSLSRLFLLLIFSTSVVSLTVLIATRILFPLIATPQYAFAYNVTVLLQPAVAIGAIQLFGEMLLGVTQKNHIIALVVSFCVFLSLCANLLLIPLYGIYGSIISSNLVSLILGSSMIMAGRKLLYFPIDWKKLSLSLLMFCGNTGCILLVSRLVNGIAFVCVGLFLLVIMIITLFRGDIVLASDKNILRRVINRL